MRVSGKDVKLIIDTTLDAAEVEAFIRSANLLVTEELVGRGMSEERLVEIERWLAAHFVAVRDKRAASEGIGAANMTFQGQTAMGLDSTTYGQQAKLLDTSGRLASMGARKPLVQVARSVEDA